MASKLLLTLILLNICLTIYSIYSAYDSYMTLRSQSIVVIQVLSNWETKVITDLVSTTNSTCASPYTDSFSFQWPGMMPGCDCSHLDSTQLQNQGINCTICSFSCSSSLTQAGCKPISSIAKQNISFWGFYDDQPVKLCVKREDIDYRDSFRLTTTNFCGSGMKICGGIVNGSVLNPFCMPNSSLCPINGLQVSWVLLNDTNATANCTKETDCFTFQKNSSHVQQVVMSRNTPKLPIVELSINQYGICEDDTVQNLDPNYVKYPLWSGPNSSCSQSPGANLWDASIDTLTESSLLNASGLYDSIASLPQYPMQNMAINWSLWIRGYVWWDSKCITEFDDFLNTVSAVDGVLTAQTYDLTCAILTGVLVGIIIPILHIIAILLGDEKYISNQNENNKESDTSESSKSRKPRVYIWFIQKKGVFGWIIKTLQVPVVIIALILSYRTYDIYLHIHDNLCINARYRNTIAAMSGQLLRIETNNIKFCVVLVAMIILELILWKYQAKLTSYALAVKDSAMNRCLKKKKQNSSITPEDAEYHAQSTEKSHISEIELQNK